MSWEEIIQAVQDLWYGFWDVVGQVLTAIWDVVVFVVTNILPAVLVVIGGVLAVTTVLAIFSPIAAGLFVEGIIAATTAVVSVVVKISVFAFQTVIAAADALILGFQFMLSYINFAAILEIHEILMIVSDDYRALISQLYTAISEASEALFGNTFMLHFMLQGTKALIMTTSSILGFPTDISEFQWFIALDDITVKMNEKAEIYMTEPEQLLYDLEEWSEKAAINNAAAWQLGRTGIMEGVIKVVHGTALELNTLGKDYNAFKVGLPGEREGVIHKYLDPVMIKLGDFHFSDYERNRLDTGFMIKDNRNELDNNRKTMQGIKWDTERPSRSFGKIEGLPDDDRILEEEIIENYASRELSRDNEKLVERHNERIQQEDKEKVTEELHLPPPSWQTVFEKEVITMEMEKSKRRDSPFVGDY